MTKKEMKYEYKMPKEYAKSILALKRKEGSKLEPQAYLCNYVNTQCGLAGTCIAVSTY